MKKILIMVSILFIALTLGAQIYPTSFECFDSNGETVFGVLAGTDKRLVSVSLADSTVTDIVNIPDQIYKQVVVFLNGDVVGMLTTSGVYMWWDGSFHTSGDMGVISIQRNDHISSEWANMLLENGALVCMRYDRSSGYQYASQYNIGTRTTFHVANPYYYCDTKLVVGGISTIENQYFGYRNFGMVSIFGDMEYTTPSEYNYGFLDWNVQDLLIDPESNVYVVFRGLHSPEIWVSKFSNGEQTTLLKTTPNSTTHPHLSYHLGFLYIFYGNQIKRLDVQSNSSEWEGFQSLPQEIKEEFVFEDKLYLRFQNGFSVVFLGSEYQLPTPQNVRLEVQGSNMFLIWDPVEDVDAYRIYSSTDPNGIFIYQYEVGTGNTYRIYLDDEKRFYKVSAVRY